MLGIGYTPKDANYLVIEPGSYMTKAGKADYQVMPENCILTRIAPKPSSDGADSPPSYLAGEALSTALTTGQIPTESVIYPIQGGKVVDWAAIEHLIKHVFTKEMQLKRARNEHPLIAVLPPQWGPDDADRLCQIAFEVLNCPGFYLAEAPVCAVYGAGITSGVVADLGHETMTIACVVDNVLIKHSTIVVDVGGRDAQALLKKHLLADSQFLSELGGEPSDALVLALRESDVCEVKHLREQTTEKGLAALKRIDLDSNLAELSPFLKGKKVSVGPYRLKTHEVFFDPILVGKNMIGLPEALAISIGQATDSLEKRLMLWENVLVTGGCCCVKGLKDRLEKDLEVHLAASETAHEFQAKEVKYAKIPEFFAAYKDRGNGAVYLGATIVAKV
ncbi:hypothetical protein HK101_011112 [Irineochytrium annulatum]|nr:hypothetical protein HK101_011112 [Irineochytrium annulatum]